MPRYEGVMVLSELEGGFWQLDCADGRLLTLANADAGLRRVGLRVQIEGEEQDDAVGISMAGPVLRVRSFRVVG